MRQDIRIISPLFVLLLSGCTHLLAKSPEPAVEPLVRVVDLDVGQTRQVILHDGRKVKVTLLDLKEKRDSVRNAVRQARVEVKVDDKVVSLVSSTYHLPQTVGNVQIDCPVTRGYLARSSKSNAWGLLRDARQCVGASQGRPASTVACRFSVDSDGYVCVSGRAEVVRRRHADGQCALLCRRRGAAGQQEHLLSLRAGLRRRRRNGTGACRDGLRRYSFPKTKLGHPRHFSAFKDMRRRQVGPLKNKQQLIKALQKAAGEELAEKAKKGIRKVV